MKKYTLHRSLGSLERDIKKHELVAVEYGEDIDDVTNALMKAAEEDITGLEKYQKYYQAASYAPELVKSFMRVKRYTHMMTVVLYPDCGKRNDLIDYGIIETAANAV